MESNTRHEDGTNRQVNSRGMAETGPSYSPCFIVKYLGGIKLLDIANALSFLHMQLKPILHGAVCLVCVTSNLEAETETETDFPSDVVQENVMCPISDLAGNDLTDTVLSVHACLSDFRSVKPAPGGDTSHDVKGYGRLVVEVSCSGSDVHRKSDNR